MGIQASSDSSLLLEDARQLVVFASSSPSAAAVSNSRDSNFLPRNRTKTRTRASAKYSTTEVVGAAAGAAAASASYSEAHKGRRADKGFNVVDVERKMKLRKMQMLLGINDIYLI